MGASPGNTYYLCWPRGQKKEPVAWNPFEPCPESYLQTAPKYYVSTTPYFGGVFRALEQHLDQTGLVFYLTPDLYKLPAYGPHVVAVVQADERSRIPLYFHKVCATFKCYGTQQACLPRLLARPSYQNALAHAFSLRDALLRLPGRLHYRRQARRLQDLLPPVYAIPPGYANQLNLPIKPFDEREMDLFFAGSVMQGDRLLERWIGTPKELARREMLAGLEKARHHLPGLKVDLRLQPRFGRSIRADAAEYSEGLMNARICLAPRGASFETYRFFEAMRYGCITIAEALPPHWFYEDAPAVQVSDWRHLPDTLAALLGDPDRMRALHEAALAWWERRCSEAALGRFFADKLNRCSEGV